MPEPIFVFLNRKLHIVSFNIPWPPDYGGAMDVYATAAALHARGVEVILHCFAYGQRQPIPGNQRFFSAVHYYKRRFALPFRLPYIVSSRRNESLFKRLLEDDAPILLEGTHCAWPVFDPRFAGRKMAVRVFNVEAEYYAGLARLARPGLRKWYYRRESRLLKAYEARLAQKAMLLTLSQPDTDYFTGTLGAANVHFMPSVFYAEPAIPVGTGQYCLYHGNLSVEENAAIAEWLIKDVFDASDIPLVIAGKNPPLHLVQLAQGKPGITLVPNPTAEAMQKLVHEAQLNVLPAHNSTGVKLKMLYALHNGRFCVTNAAGNAGLPVQNLAAVVETADDFKKWIAAHFHKPFTEALKAERLALLKENFNAGKQVEALMQYLW